ncbi:MAG: pyridoxamine 5'-phosphate oxidase family protein [Acidimicrobiales bacterium]|nr:pyridoxamine 5'-phosphate oxidase family protein [Acidimicrobiales bacterium]
MTTWQHLATAAPDLAARARAVLASSTNAVLGTVRADGSPRLSGIDPWFSRTQLCFGSMPAARKLADLARDPRLALHSVPWESRRPAEGEDLASVIEADVKVAGRARAVTDRAELHELAEAFAAHRGFPMPGDPDEAEEDDGGAMFTVEIDALALTSVADDQLVIEMWSPDGGLRTVRRD